MGIPIIICIKFNVFKLFWFLFSLKDLKVADAVAVAATR